MTSIHQIKFPVNIYATANEHHMETAALILDHFKNFFEWKDTQISVLDVGSGTGCTTAKILKKYLPGDFKELIGLDICSEMTEFAQRHYQSKKVNFIQRNIIDDVSDDMKERFHFIVSFFALHFVQDQRKLYQNLYELQAPGGLILLSHVISSPIYPAYELLAKGNKWSKYMKHLKHHLNPFRYSKNPKEDCLAFAKTAGFSVEFCEVVADNWKYPDISSFRKFISCVNTWTRSIPSNLHEDFIDDMVSTIIGNSYVKVQDDGQILKSFEIIVVLGSKN